MGSRLGGEARWFKAQGGPAEWLRDRSVNLHGTIIIAVCELCAAFSIYAWRFLWLGRLEFWLVAERHPAGQP
jgi:hypothetical protein